eukprot:scaffold65919_cov37-Phaeocystis_antarctica.AAC.3
MFSACARCHQHSAGQPCWTRTERRGLVDGALRPADDVRDVSTSQTSSAVAARDGAEQVAQPAVRGRSRPIEQLMNASSLYSMRIIGEQTSPLADDVQCSKIWQQATRSLQCQRYDAAGLPDCRRLIERGQPRPRELPRGVRHVWPGTDSRVAQSCSAVHELLLLSWAAASQRRA